MRIASLMSRVLLGAILPAVFAEALSAQTASSRIVSLSGATSEILYELGLGDAIVAVSTGQQFPEAVRAKPAVGALRVVTAEPILSARPTLVLADSAMPTTTVSQLRGVGVRVELVGNDRLGSVVSRIRTVARIVGKPVEGERLAQRVERELAEASNKPAPTAPRVLFIYARGSGTAFVGGPGSGADEIIVSAGGRNALTGFEGYRPVTAEAVATSRAEIILVASRGLASIGGVDGLLELPGVAQTPAARARRIVAVDDQLLLGFGPRTAEAIKLIAGEFGRATSHVR